MNIDNLAEGLVIKNYKELIALLGEEVKSGNAKIRQIKDLEQYCQYHKEGNKFIIEKIYKNPIVRNLGLTIGRVNGNWKEYNQFKVDYNNRENIGVYYILKDKDIYIGSTINGFRTRFKEHYHGYDERMQHTYKLLQNGGEFFILHDMQGIEDEALVRMVENEYIQYFINKTAYSVINKKEKAYSITEKKLKYKSIKIREGKYEQAIQLLMDNGLLEMEEDSSLILNQAIKDFDINNIPF